MCMPASLLFSSSDMHACVCARCVCSVGGSLDLSQVAGRASSAEPDSGGRSKVLFVLRLHVCVHLMREAMRAQTKSMVATNVHGCILRSAHQCLY